MNDETGRVNSAVDYMETSEPKEDTIPEMAKRWRARGEPWMVVGDVRCHSAYRRG
jgi:homoaconitase